VSRDRLPALAWTAFTPVIAEPVNMTL